MLNLREKKRGRREEDDEREKRLRATPRIFMREMRAYQVSREREVIRI
jgi:hypothetical protein